MNPGTAAQSLTKVFQNSTFNSLLELKLDKAQPHNLVSLQVFCIYFRLITVMFITNVIWNNQLREVLECLRSLLDEELLLDVVDAVGCGPARCC